jgi:hypothetical protein
MAKRKGEKSFAKCNEENEEAGKEQWPGLVVLPEHGHSNG